MNVNYLIPNNRISLVNDVVSLCKLKFRRNVVLQRNVSNIRPVTMAFARYGDDHPMVDNSPIIIMHGLFGSKENWFSMGKVMAKVTEKKVYVVDARNHGDSPHTDEHSYLHLSEDLRNFYKEHGINKAALIGHCMGGRAMMTLAIQNPEKVESLTVVDISPADTPRGMEYMMVLFRVMESIEPIASSSLSVARQIVQTSSLQNYLAPRDISSFLTMLFSEEAGRFTWRINLKAITKNYDPHISTFPISVGNFKGRTMFVCGEKSDFVNFDHLDKIQVFFPEATFVKIENGGHWVHYEQPLAFMEVVSQFILSSRKK